MSSTRLDVALVNRKLAPSRQQAQSLIMAGQVRINAQPATKAGQEVTETDVLEVMAQEHYVSRGAYKLLKAIDDYVIDVNDLICLDVGASTGGFTQVMLEAGAKKVYSVDVGYGQFDYRLRTDERVVVLERQNARFLTRDIITDPIDFFSMDVSFISIKLLLPVVKALLRKDCEGVVLIKPQFEAGRHQVGKGVITDPAIHRAVIEDILEHLVKLDLDALHLGYSPIKGPKGNREFLLHLKNRPSTHQPIDVAGVVETAHREL